MKYQIIIFSFIISTIFIGCNPDSIPKDSKLHNVNIQDKDQCLFELGIPNKISKHNWTYLDSSTNLIIHFDECGCFGGSTTTYETNSNEFKSKKIIVTSHCFGCSEKIPKLLSIKEAKLRYSQLLKTNNAVKQRRAKE